MVIIDAELCRRLEGKAKILIRAAILNAFEL